MRMFRLFSMCAGLVVALLAVSSLRAQAPKLGQRTAT